MMIVLIILLVVSIIFVAWCCIKPVSICLTFDDGLLAHYTIVAPILEEKGWRGVFNVPTKLLRPYSPGMTPKIAKSLRLEGHENCLMTWDQVRDLLDRGHEVYPHTCTHVNLKELVESGKTSEAECEISESRRMILEQTGVAPKFFCEPYLQTTPAVKALIRKHGMKPYNCNRPGFGSACASECEIAVQELLETRRREGRLHVDLMVHGILKEEGGWRAFGSASDFYAFVEQISDMVSRGTYRIVRYDKAHGYWWIDVAITKIRRIVYCLLGRLLKWS